MTEKIDHSSAPQGRVILVTAMSGAGRSSALKALEDLGYEAVDNLPLSLFNRHFPANLQIHGNRIYTAPPRELHSLPSPPMTRLWRADHVRKAIWQRFPPSRHTSPVFSTLPSISSAYAGTGLRRRSSIKAKIFWNKIFDTATSASWNVT